MDTVQIEQKGAVTWVWLNRSERLNALNEQVITTLCEVFAAFRENTTTRVIVLAGRGGTFCAGFDIEWMASRTPEMVRQDRADLRAFYELIESCPQPVICAVQGNAMGGGLILTMVSDFVVAADTARFGAPEIKIGIFPSLHLIPRLERLVGLRAAKSIVLTGDPVDAQTALQIGLISQVTSLERLYEVVQALAEQLAMSPSHASKAIKEAFSTHLLPNFSDWETNTAVECWSQPARQELMQAFLNKRRSRL